MNSPWNSAWLPRIAADSRGREKRVPASTVHTVTDSHHGRAIPSQPGIAPPPATCPIRARRSEEHTSELQSRGHLVCRLLLEKKKDIRNRQHRHNQSISMFSTP